MKDIPVTYPFSAPDPSFVGPQYIPWPPSSVWPLGLSPSDTIEKFIEEKTKKPFSNYPYNVYNPLFRLTW